MELELREPQHMGEAERKSRLALIISAEGWPDLNV